MTIKELQKQSFEIAKSKGWASPTPTIPEQLALLHSEVSEALESYRAHEPLSWSTDDGKPSGVASEFADILIRVGHYCEVLGIDLQAEVERKMKYNQSRPWRHGGKRL